MYRQNAPKQKLTKEKEPAKEKEPEVVKQVAMAPPSICLNMLVWSDVL